MISYTKINVNLISLVISIIIFLCLNSIYGFMFKSISKSEGNVIKQENIANNIEVAKETENITKKDSTNQLVEKSKENKSKVPKKEETEWRIEIKAISLSAQIADGTTDNIMNKYVGHFTDTSKKKGNIGLAAHNRGYPVNYFQNIRKLRKGDEIKYTYGKFKKTYIVDKIEIIKDEDWTYLEKTDDNRITLITCVENEPNYRRCIQGIEK